MSPITFVVILLPLVGAREIYFLLGDSDVNEVVFVGERDIVMRCGVTSLPPADVKIQHNGIIVANNSKLGRDLQYSITEIKIEDGGNYTCTIKDIDKQTTLLITLNLNVHFKLTPQCIHNGTEGIPYVEGDVTLLSCYCPPHQVCSWARTIVDLRVANVTMPDEIKTVHNKTVSRIVVKGPIFAKGNGTRFDCFSLNTKRRCPIRFNVSSSDEFNLLPKSTDCSSFTTGHFLEKVETSPPSMKFTIAIKDMKSKFTKVSLIIIPVIALVGLFAVVISTLFICFYRRRNKTDNGVRAGPKDLIENPSVTNSAYITSEKDSNVEFHKTDLLHYKVPVAKINNGISVDKCMQDIGKDMKWGSQQLNDSYEDIPALARKRKAMNIVSEFGTLYAEVKNDMIQNEDSIPQSCINPRGDRRKEARSRADDACEPYGKIGIDAETYQYIPDVTQRRQATSVQAGGDFSELYADVNKDRKREYNGRKKCPDKDGREWTGEEFSDVSEQYTEIVNDTENYQDLLATGLARNRQARSVAGGDFSELYSKVKKGKIRRR